MGNLEGLEVSLGHLKDDPIYKCHAQQLLRKCVRGSFSFFFTLLLFYNPFLSDTEKKTKAFISELPQPLPLKISMLSRIL